MKTLIRDIVRPLRRHPPLFRAIRAVFQPGRDIYRHLHFIGQFTVNVSDAASFKINHFGYQVENELFWTKFGDGWEGQALRIWCALAADARFIADVGANTGVYSLAAAATNPKAKVAALEPVPRIFERACANLKLNSFDILPLQIAASDTDGEAVLFDDASEHNYSASLDATMLAGSNIIRIPVRAARLDTLFPEIGWPRIDLLKIDVEKHEPAVLAGMTESLSRDRPTLLIEILEPNIGEAVGARLRGLGYRAFAIAEEAGLIETTQLFHP